jgi:hypothetical protein
MIANLVSRTIRRRLDLDINVHLFRHIGTMLYLDAHPGHFGVPQVMLGHTSTKTRSSTPAPDDTGHRHFTAAVLGARNDRRQAQDRLRIVQHAQAHAVFRGQARCLAAPALRLLDLRRAPAGPLELPSVASSWRETTFNLHLWNVGYFVGWLKWSGRFRTTDLYVYATAAVIGAYVDDMRGFGLSTTIATRVDGVRASLAALSPSTSTDWLMHGISKLRDEPSDRRAPSEIAAPALGRAGMDLMGQAAPGNQQTPRKQSVSRRPDDRFPGAGGAKVVASK